MKHLTYILFLSFLLTSCYVHTYTVGEGAKGSLEVTEKQHNFVYGLASGKTPDTKSMAKGSDNYTITNQITFIDGLINSLTLGLYNPSSVTVKR
jgi:hypothetical protein